MDCFIVLGCLRYVSVNHHGWTQLTNEKGMKYYPVM